ncbi:acyl-CoA dehydrogenase family protein [Paracidovorax wautersii]|uniref:Alkylation response protein AidB-like acyl-CoA dehydrogenase n=1 Tax=Paracidovorax wautersii TaxID=1177982 RepID=A0ABU1I784_9BURK|nr:acyl-CoA dehydrogenase family protein [Paracidovorax wautersii]MDR6213067.1 alkylation response protein AidB-like acyl-CoA dehydrogenase [Paracidovorax wautersii]
MSAAIDQTLRFVPQATRDWLAAQAAALDTSAAAAPEVLRRLGDAGLLRVGVPAAQGGAGGDTRDAVAAIAEVARLSLAAAFVLWGQRCYIDFVLQGGSPALQQAHLPALLAGTQAGATGLSNAMKYLSCIEPLQLQATPAEGGTGGGHGGWSVSGRMHWVTNLHADGFLVAAAVRVPGTDAPVIVSIDSRSAGVRRSADLDLLALRGTHTAAIDLQGAAVPASAVLAVDGPRFLRAARPGFLAMQCGMSIGLAQAALASAQQHMGDARAVLAPRIGAAQAALQAAVAAIDHGLLSGQFEAQPVPLFQVRLQLAALVQEALQLELQATGGKAYLLDRAPDFGRRWRESAFIPVITPSLTQLQAALAQAGVQAPAATGVAAAAAAGVAA